MTAGTVPDGEIERTVTAADVRAALAQLSAENRQVVVEIYFRRRSIQETAEALGIPLAAAIARSYHGLHELRCAIEIVRHG